MWSRVRAVIVVIPWLLVRLITFLLRPFVWLISLAVIGLVFLILIVPTTPRDVAYRNIDPVSDVCGFSSDRAWDVLADRASMTGAAVDNDEMAAIAKFLSGGWDKKFSCALQRHVIPGASDGEALFYNLAFVEFREDGTPYELIKDIGLPYPLDELSSRIRFVDSEKREAITQLRALTNLLRETPGRNYVIVFVHGWRHDARVGDDNVAALRRYAGHAARFLKERCQAGERAQCDRVVTAVFVGWRGARIDERRVVEPFVALGSWLDAGTKSCRRDKPVEPATPSATRKCWRDLLEGWGNGVASLFAALTLFDRKPVSEAIAPHVLTAVRSIESTFDTVEEGRAIPYYDKLRNSNRLLVIGHSLGGNLLATALEHDAVKHVEWQAQRNAEARQQGGTPATGRAAASRVNPQNYFDPLLGNLVVLINPASEARKWTSIQRAIWQRVIYREGDAKLNEDYGHNFFPDYQRPVVVAVTSAFAWPPGGIRTEDCAVAFNYNQKLRDNPPAMKGAAELLRKETRLHAAIADVDKKSQNGGVVYDTATHDLFPFFKFDFRPMADRLDRYGRLLANQKVPRLSCDRDPAVTSWWPRLLINIAAYLRDAPFQESDMEETRTIGNLDVPRHAAGTLDDYLLPSKPFGTTHEIRGIGDPRRSMSYSTLATSKLFECPISDFWLSRARRQHPPHGTTWDSEDLAPAAGDENPAAKSLSTRITHGFDMAGIQPVTRANDPFWNMRAYDDVIAEHSGYRLSSFICAVNQLVMDEPTRIPTPPKPPVAAEIPRNPAERLPDFAPPVILKKD
ncbi:hypothetical protein C2U70_28010 [Bradyrhizobium guangdongense]|uniref:hypothetical protein n=1 Tax=Bradyrhizobium guangdongense TaxID=1325090 RepID=UPI00112E1E81|nr:hypothetical protein [Bradyrhizobium guangdongense]TPQ29857.1 hypothetical protein C2U70_28010 [Bradyrhizobium guangdongense]